MDGIHAPINTPVDLVNSNDITSNVTNIENRKQLLADRKASRLKRERDRNARRGTAFK